jgi:outer membrane autotransporter protein
LNDIFAVKKTRPLSMLAAFLMFSAHGTIALAQVPPGSLPWENSTTAAQLQAAIDQALIEKRIPGASVAIRQGDVRWTSNSGLADVANGTAPTADTYFGYRSITKSFVTTVILQLAEEGRIDLDDPVSKYVDVPSGGTMTIRQLAEMRSGLFNYTASPAFGEQFGENPGKAWTASELLAFAFDEPAQFAPGASYEYSNSNTVLLGEVIKAATGNDWSEEVKTRLTDKLGMDSVINQGAGTMPTPNAVGYIDLDDGEGPVSLAEFNASGTGASGALVGVIADAERWGKAVGSGELISKRAFVERLKSFGSIKPDPLSPEYDSYGFGMGEISGFIGHTGNGLGFEALVMYDRANDRTITILINSSNPDDPDAPAHLFKQLLAILDWNGPAGQIQVAADGTDEVVGSGTVWTGLISGPFGARAAVYAANGGSAVADGRATLAPLQDYVPAIFIGSGGRVELGLGGDITAALGGDGAFLRAETGTGSLVLTDVNIVLNGDEVSGTGVDVRDNSEAMLNRVKITGGALAGLHAGGDAPAAIDGAEVAIDLTSGDGVWVEPNGKVQLTDSSIQLSGAGSGLHVTGGDGTAQLLGTRLDVQTKAAGSYGILAQGDGAKVDLKDSLVTTYGADAHAVVLGDGARVDLSGTSVLAYGTAAAAVAAVSIDGAATSILSLSDSALAAASGTAVVAAGTDLKFTASNSQVVGAITRSSDASIDLALQNGSSWVIPAAGVAVNSRVDDLVNSNSSIAFARPVGSSPAVFQSLTVANYQGVNGTLVMNAALTGASDRLIIDGGTATGKTSVIVQTLGSVKPTSGDGISLIQAIHGGQTDPGSFALGRRVAVGAYEYDLYRGGASGTDDWFLRSTRSGGTGPDAVPNLRPEVPVDTALPAIASQYSMAILGTHSERAAARATQPGGHANDAWARLFGETGSQGSSGGNAATQLDRFLKNGPSYDVDLAGFQAGYDVVVSNPGEAIQNTLGFYVGSGQARGNVDAVYGGPAGKVSMDAYSLGAYWTHTQASGLYIDTVLQGTFFTEASASSDLGEQLRSDGFGLNASLEAGYRFDLGGGWAIEPQAQLVYQRLSFEDGADSFGSVNFDAANDVLGGIGARVSRDWLLESGTKLTGSARASLWNAFGDGTEVAFADLSGANAVSFESGLGGTSLQLDLDASMAVSESVSLFVAGDYDVRVDSEQGHAVGGRIGFNVSW